jgi:uncharacterized membrane protein YfcA
MTIFLLGFGAVLVYFGANIGYYGPSNTPSVLGGGLLIAVGLVRIWKKIMLVAEQTQFETDANLKLKDSKYKHIYLTSGIGIDVENKTVHLISNSVEKKYSFSDIRNWRTNVASGGGIVGGMATTGGMAGTAQNMQILAANKRAQKENISESGLFIEVKDIENPLWQIMFEHDKKLNVELARWMEILNQCIADKDS